MDKKSLNQLYNESKSKDSYKDWLNKGTAMFNAQMAAKKMPPSTPFLWWANAYYAPEFQLAKPAAPAAAKPTAVVTKPAPVATKTAAPAPTNPVFHFSSVTNVNGQAVLKSVSGANFKPGEQIIITSPIYKGTFTVTKQTQAGSSPDVYISAGFSKNDSGTFTKVVPAVKKSADGSADEIPEDFNANVTVDTPTYTYTNPELTVPASSPGPDWNKIFGTAATTFKTVAPVLGKGSSTSGVQSNVIKPTAPGTTILGMTPVVFIAVSVVVLGVIGFGIYAIYQANK